MKILYDDGKRLATIGEIKNRILIKRVNRNKHYLRVVSGYAIQQVPFDKYEPHFDKIQFLQSNPKAKFEISKLDFTLHRSKWSAGHGTQYTISEKYLTEIK